jgi:signal transduction histidine kinase
MGSATDIRSATTQPIVRHSLSARLLWLTVAMVLITELLIFLPSLGRARRAWLYNHVTEAHIAALSLASTPQGSIDQHIRDELLELSGAMMVSVEDNGRPTLVLARSEPVEPTGRVDLRTETDLEGLRNALFGLIGTHDRLVLVTASSPLRQSATVQVIVSEHALVADLRRYARNVAGLSLVIAGITGVLIYLALLAFLVRPMQRITSSIAAFRADPEFTAPIDPTRVTLLPGDEIAVAGRELAAMQRELRGALWRNARLAALGAAVAKVSHDLRGILSAAMLSADRLESHPDPAVRKAADVIAASIQRGVEIVRKTLDFAREGPPPLQPSAFDLGELVDDVAAVVTGGSGSCVVTNRVGLGTLIRADRDQLYRVISNLLRNAAEAGSDNVAVSVVQSAHAGGSLAIDIEDDGPGLPDAVRRSLFRPFTTGGRTGGTGLGLAIARDLLRAHGGDIELRASSDAGTTFRLALPPSSWPRRASSSESAPERVASHG